MAFMDVPAKIIERAETLTEAKMKVSQEFTQFLYQQDEKLPLTEENLVATFKSIYDEINAYIPQSDVAGLSKIPKKRLIYLIIALISSLIISYSVYYTFFR